MTKKPDGEKGFDFAYGAGEFGGFGVVAVAFSFIGFLFTKGRCAKNEKTSGSWEREVFGI